ncbi:MAG: glycosyltransferase [Chloroflexi bacterium]|nr:glycosyltransferase [Chloroflexota bacterium]
MTMPVKELPPERRLRLCVVGDLEGVHTQSWLRYFVQRGHEVHGVSYYTPARPPEGVLVHTLRPALPRKGGRPQTGSRKESTTARLAHLLPPGLQRVANLLRYRRAGIRRTVEAIAPDVLHAHYLVEHGLYATAANYHPYVVSAWGSDVLVEAARSPINRALARFVLRRTDLATANNRYMAREMVLKLGIDRARVQHIVLGVERDFIDRGPVSVNAQPPESKHVPTLISTRSLDMPLYNVDVIIRAMARVRESLPAARLVVAGDGRLRGRLERLAAELGLSDAVRFTGVLAQPEFRAALSEAEVFVSVPSSDGTSVALLQAQAAGCFPIVSDLPSQQELVEHGVTGLRVPVRDEAALAEAICAALEDGSLRRDAVERNRAFVEEYGVQETNMARMEAWYYRLAGRAGEADVIDI